MCPWVGKSIGLKVGKTRKVWWEVQRPEIHLREANKKKEGKECPQRSLGDESGLEGGGVIDTVVEKKQLGRFGR